MCMPLAVGEVCVDGANSECDMNGTTGNRGGMDWKDWAVGTIKVSSAGGVSRMGRVDSVSGVIGWHEQGE
jgi:hypothetical protein